MTIAFLGDSITFGYGLADKKMGYPTLVSEALGMEECNYGITGTLVAKAGMNKDDERSYLSRASLTDDADVAIIFGGTNDYFWSDEPIYGEGEQYFSFAVKALAARAKKKRSGRITLFVTPYPHNGIGNFYGGSHAAEANRHDTSERNYNGHTLKEYVDVIELVCKEEGLPCLNLFTEIDFDWRRHTSDGCHPNEEGHALLARAISVRLGELMGK